MQLWGEKGFGLAGLLCLSLAKENDLTSLFVVCCQRLN